MDNSGAPPRILVVEESRIARATIIKHLGAHYDCREEGDGEAAWQILVLDQSIDLVICSLSLPILSGDDLLVRVRASRLSRLNQMPMLMISGDDAETLTRAQSHGASDFIGRNAVQAELLTRIDSLLKLSRIRKQLHDNLELNVQNPATGLFTRKYIELQAIQAISLAQRHNSDVSVMLLDFDSFDELRTTYGQEAAAELQKRFVTVLSSKIRKEDSLGHFADSRLVIISPGTSIHGCEIFGNRLRNGICSANISIHGQRLNLSVSIGISNTPTDKASTAEALLELAAQRLRAAQQAGGNRIITGINEALRTETVAPSLERALNLIRSGNENEVLAHLNTLGKQLLPLLRLMERDLKLGLNIADIEDGLTNRGDSTASRWM